ncbi:MAG TPA: hypothetical protein VLZ74_16140 [Methylocella sp.]|nr:hypothetical protein [Methylocella sp.]
MAEDAGVLVRKGRAGGVSLSWLPKQVRLIREVPAKAGNTGQLLTGMYEFEVAMGNAAYQEGERFYLTRAQAQQAYLFAPHST